MVRFIVLFIEVRRFMEYNLLKGQGKMFNFHWDAFCLGDDFAF